MSAGVPQASVAAVSRFANRATFSSRVRLRTHFVVGVGTGETLTGAGRRLKEHDPRIKIVSISNHCEDTFTSKTSVPEWDRQFRLVRVHHEHREELGRLRLAGIGADAVAVAGQLGEALSGLVGRHRSVVDLTADRPLKHGRVDEGGFGMRVASE